MGFGWIGWVHGDMGNREPRPCAVGYLRGRFSQEACADAMLLSRLLACGSC